MLKLSKIIALCLIAVSIQSVAHADNAKGTNATHVVFGDASGTALGTYRQTGPGTWMEDGFRPGSNRFQFRELGRDEWSVYLQDSSRNVSIQIDLWTKKIMYRDAASPQGREIYRVINATGKATGQLVSVVEFSDFAGRKLGTYRKSGRGWIERSNSGRVFNFQETGRDDWSVYLLDRSRGVEIQLDLHTGKVRYGLAGQAKRDLYKISNAS